MSYKKLSILIIALGAILLAGCSLPEVPTEPPSPTPALAATATAAPTGVPTQTLPPVITATPPATQAPTEAQTQAPIKAPTTAPTAAPSVPGQIVRFPSGSDVTVTQVHMTSKAEGWAVGVDLKLDSNNEHVLRTADGGATWRDVTPPQKASTAAVESGPSQRAQAFFLDAQKAWIAFAPQPGSVTDQARVVWSTADGGASWKTSAPLAQSSGSNPDIFDFGQPTFLPDGKSGWVMVHAGAGMNHDYIYIFGTGDGGLTWKMLVDPMDVNKGQIQGCYKSGMGFVDAQHGWLAGSCNGVAAGVLLFQTKDGGSNWSEVKLPAPSDSPTIFTAQDVSCGSFPPVFFSAKDGLMQVSCQSFDGTKVAKTWLYATADGGATWKARLAPASLGSYQFISAAQGWFVGDSHIFATADGGKTWANLAKVDWNAQLSFVDAKNGWVVATMGSTPNVSYALVNSVDGGTRWGLLKPKISK